VGPASDNLGDFLGPVGRDDALLLLARSARFEVRVGARAAERELVGVSVECVVLGPRSADPGPARAGE